MELASIDEVGDGDPAQKHWWPVAAVAGYVLLFRGRACSKSVSDRIAEARPHAMRIDLSIATLYCTPGPTCPAPLSS